MILCSMTSKFIKWKHHWKFTRSSSISFIWKALETWFCWKIVSVIVKYDCNLSLLGYTHLVTVIMLQKYSASSSSTETLGVRSQWKIAIQFQFIFVVKEKLYAYPDVVFFHERALLVRYILQCASFCSLSVCVIFLCSKDLAFSLLNSSNKIDTIQWQNRRCWITGCVFCVYFCCSKYIRK